VDRRAGRSEHDFAECGNRSFDPVPDGIRAAGLTQVTIMTRALPFTSASLARAIKGVERAGRFVIGVRPDGTLIVGDKPVDSASIVPAVVQNVPTSKWEDQRA
jgi:hypothetical protein